MYSFILVYITDCGIAWGANNLDSHSLLAPFSPFIRY